MTNDECMDEYRKIFRKYLSVYQYVIKLKCIFFWECHMFFHFSLWYRRKSCNFVTEIRAHLLSKSLAIPYQIPFYEKAKSK